MDGSIRQMQLQNKVWYFKYLSVLLKKTILFIIHFTFKSQSRGALIAVFWPIFISLYKAKLYKSNLSFPILANFLCLFLSEMLMNTARKSLSCNSGMTVVNWKHAAMS